MPGSIQLNLNAKVDGGPALSAHQAIPVDGYDHVRVDIPEGAAGLAVDVQPADAEDVQLLIVRCLDPAGYAAGIAYSPDPNAAAAARVALDNVHVLAGTGAVALLGGDPKTLHFWRDDDDGASPLTVEILAGRRPAA